MVTRNVVVGLIVSLGLGAAAWSFISGSAPFVSAKEAMASKANNNHVYGSLVPGSLKMSGDRAAFLMKDDEGTVMPVEYKGESASQLATAQRVVVIGGWNGEVMKSDQINFKCPSKYNSTSQTGKA